MSAVVPFELERVFAATPEQVYAAWTDADQLARWWGPAGCELRVLRLELAPGGTFLYGMSSPLGDLHGKFVYRELVAPSRLVYVSSFTDADGGVLRHPLSDTWPLETLSELTLTPVDGGTLLRLSGGPLDATAEEEATFAGAHESLARGFGGTLDQLASHLQAVSSQ